METISLKALSIRRLQGNLQGNIPETSDSFHGNIPETLRGNSDIDQMEKEYLKNLARFWAIDTNFSIPMDESRRLDERLSELYRALHQAGRRVPVRLPVGRRQNHERRKQA
ncbi:MAG: hypothetical protein VB050_13250 [Geobacteraceae bacterium]|nr:hypothetical protein [Geobacteraceae bacterium]